MEVSTQHGSPFSQNFGYLEKYSNGPSFSNDPFISGCYSKQYDFNDDNNMGFDSDDCMSTGESSSSGFSGSEKSHEEYSDDGMDIDMDFDQSDGEHSDGDGYSKDDALELAATAEMLRIRFPYQSITIRLADFCCLQEKDLLNDTIVDFYLNHIVEHTLPDDPSKRVTVLPAVFWHNLSILHSVVDTQDNTLSAEQKLDARFGDVFDFVEGFDLLDVDYIVIPVNEWEHWSLIVVCNPFTAQGRIVCFDSQLTDDHNNLQNIGTLIDDFLKYAWSRWRKEECGLTLPCVIPQNLAQQVNNFDCGVYILEFAHRFLLAPPKNLDEFDFAAEYSDFNVKNSRREMQKTVLSLCSDRSLWNPIVDMLNARN